MARPGRAPAVRRGGTAVIVGMAPTGSEISIPSTIAGEEKIVKGCFYGSSRPAVDFRGSLISICVVCCRWIG